MLTQEGSDCGKPLFNGIQVLPFSPLLSKRPSSPKDSPPRLQKRVTASALSILAVWVAKTTHPANRDAREKRVVGPHWGRGADGLYAVLNPDPRLLRGHPRTLPDPSFPVPWLAQFGPVGHMICCPIKLFLACPAQEK